MPTDCRDTPVPLRGCSLRIARSGQIPSHAFCPSIHGLQVAGPAAGMNWARARGGQGEAAGCCGPFFRLGGDAPRGRIEPSAATRPSAGARRFHPADPAPPESLTSRPTSRPTSRHSSRRRAADPFARRLVAAAVQGRWPARAGPHRIDHRPDAGAGRGIGRHLRPSRRSRLR